MKIRLAKGHHDLEIVVNLLNEVTEMLLKKGIKQWEHPWDATEIEVDINTNRLYVVEVDGEVICSFSIKKIDQLNSLTIKEGLYLYRIAVLPKLQGKDYGGKIIDFSICLAREKNLSLYLDCWAGNEKLKNFYSCSGLEYLGDYPEEDYMISIFKG